MCGIVGAVAQRDVVPILLEGLRRLEYRGYDSAGIAILNENAQLERVRSLGKINILEQALQSRPLSGSAGIAHTRWATHGRPAETNAHPHICQQTVAIVHNGIIENHESLRQKQKQEGHIFTSETDTEVVVHEIYKYLQETGSLLPAVQKTIAELEGAFALGVIGRGDDDCIVAARRGSPLVIGLGIGEYFIASDVSALLPVTQRFIFLEDGDVAELRREGYAIYDVHGNSVERPVRESELTASSVDRGQYRHYMQKEIFEQPRAIAETLEGRLGNRHVLEEAFGPAAPEVFDQVERVHIVACGTSYHAGLVARYWLEALAGIPCVVEVASEFRYRQPVVRDNSLFVTISQSGETADTIAALGEARKRGFHHALTICNVAESSLVRESGLSLMTRAGPEIGVASTKAFTTQLVALMLLVIVLGRRRLLKDDVEQQLVRDLRSLPGHIEEVLKLDPQIQQLAEQFADKSHALFLGRGTHFPVAMEGALKLKEISYIHAEAYPAGELKHGPLALVDAEMPIITVAPNNELLEKLKSNLQEVRARGGKLLVFADQTVNVDADEQSQVIAMPVVPDSISPIVHTVPLQLLAYHVAVAKGTDVDQPRNLAKSVTVE